MKLGNGGSGSRRVHFAPDVDKILETTSYQDSISCCDTSFDDPDISARLKLELDTCLSKLKSEAAVILGLSTDRCSRQKLFTTVDSPLSDLGLFCLLCVAL